MGIDQLWKEVERSIMFKFFVITLQCDFFIMKKKSDVNFVGVKNCFSKWK
jgi:hypothetical protein